MGITIGPILCTLYGLSWQFSRWIFLGYWPVGKVVNAPDYQTDVYGFDSHPGQSFCGMNEKYLFDVWCMNDSRPVTVV